MKKILSLIVLLVAFASCEEDVKFNDPAVQAFKDNELWQAGAFRAVRGIDNSLTVTASKGYEVVTLRTASITPGDYELGLNQNNRASYVVSADGIEMAYQTGTEGNGMIVISDKKRETDLDRGYITGTFFFKAVDEQDGAVYFDKGIFYKIPIENAQ
jgi:hypothetical protein